MKGKFSKLFENRFLRIKSISTLIILTFIGVSFITLSFTTVKKVYNINASHLSIDTILTPDNSGLLSQKVTCIFVDTFNVKWFGTNNGLSRFDGTDWDTINTDNYLLNNKINQIAYERTAYGHEIWLATNGGLSVASFTVDGITSATTYTTDEFDILNDTVTAVGVDVLHGRWIGTKSGINVFKGSNWDALLTYRDADNVQHNLSDITVNGIGSYDKNEQAYITTFGGGVLRYSYDDVDGFTGASTMGNPWSGLKTNNVNSIRIYDTTQYYGATDGFYMHQGDQCKENWARYTTNEGIISNNVRAVEVDDSGAIWIGTDAGLNIKKGKKWYTYLKSDGLVNETINDIRKDKEGIVWVATDSGVQYFTGIPGRQTGGFLPIQCRNVIASDVTSESSKIDWTIGDVGYRIAFIKEGSDGLVSPVNNTTYTANAAFGAGSEVNGWYCIYKGIGNAVTVTGLSAKTMYRVMVCEFSGDPGSEEYVTTEAVGNPANFTTLRTAVETLTGNDFRIFPNPFINVITIQNLVNHNDFEISLYNTDGRLVKKYTSGYNEYKINTGNLKSGIYIIQIRDGKSIYSIKAVKK